MDKAVPQKEAAKKSPSLLSLLKPYSQMILLLIFLALVSNGVNLVLPLLISRGIDTYNAGHFVLKTTVIEFLAAALLIFIFTYLQSIVQTYASERVARDLRTQLRINYPVRASRTFSRPTRPGY